MDARGLAAAVVVWVESMGEGRESKSSSSQPKEVPAVVAAVELTFVVVLKLVVLEGREELEEWRLAVELESLKLADEEAWAREVLWLVGPPPLSSVALPLAFATACAKDVRYCSAAFVLYLASPLLESSTP